VFFQKSLWIQTITDTKSLSLRKILSRLINQSESPERRLKDHPKIRQTPEVAEVVEVVEEAIRDLTMIKR
jgi:hypothetical protein